MTERLAHIRRARRTDFTAVMGLLVHSGLPAPPPDRPTLHRFRALVGDLGADFYVAEVDGAVVGLVHVTYARQLAVPPVARLDQLLVAEAYRRRGIAAALLAAMQGRARRRGCSRMACVVAAGAGPSGRGLLQKHGFRAAGERFELAFDAAG